MQRRTDPQRLTQFFLDHPVASGAASGFPFALVGLLLGITPWFAISVGGAFGAVIALLWRESGPAYGWRQAMLRRFPKR